MKSKKRNRREGISIISVDGLILDSPCAGYSDCISPMCGINFEANNTDCEMKDILITDALTMKNEGNGIQMGFKRMLGDGNKEIDITIVNHKDVDSRLRAFKVACNSTTNDNMSGTINVINPKWDVPTSGFPLFFSTNQPDINLNIDSPEIISTDGVSLAHDVYLNLFDNGIGGTGKLKIKKKGK